MAKKKNEDELNGKLDDAHLVDDLGECCDENCTCQKGENCTCGEENGKCDCGEDCGCGDDGCQHECHCEENENKAQEYLSMLQRMQADFENYRKHVAEELDRAREDGAESVIEAFLPSLDSFKEAKKNITDEKVLQGVNMIENKIIEALSKLKVQKIEAVGQKFDPHKHNVIALSTDESKEDGIVLEEFQAGWVKGDKVIRYSTVLVNKRN